MRCILPFAVFGRDSRPSSMFIATPPAALNLLGYIA